MRCSYDLEKNTLASFVGFAPKPHGSAGMCSATALMWAENSHRTSFVKTVSRS